GKITGSGADPADQKAMKEMAEALVKADLEGLSKAISGWGLVALERIVKEFASTLKELGITIRIDKGAKGDSSDDVLEFVDKSGKNKLIIPLDGSPAQGGDQTTVYSKNTPKLDPSDPKWAPGRTNTLADTQEENAAGAAAAIQTRLRDEGKKKI